MLDRGAFLLFLLLPLAGKSQSILAETSALQVQMYDYAGLSPDTFSEVATRTQAILTGAGVSVEVDACLRGGAGPCESQRGSLRQVVIRIIAATPANHQNSRWQHLGQSIANHDGGSYGTVYIKLAEEVAAEAELPRSLVVSYAIAHEVGHLLLGDQAHTPEGLMKARWARDDLQAMAQNRLHFNPQQCRELHRRFGTGRVVALTADESIAARH